MNTIQNALLLMTEIELLKKEVLMLTQKLENMTEANMLNARALRLNKEKLTAAQATIERLQEVFSDLQEYFELGTVGNEIVTKALAFHTDTTALQERLKQAKVEVLREAATCVLAPCARSLIRMADEIEKGESHA